MARSFTATNAAALVSLLVQVRDLAFPSLIRSPTCAVACPLVMPLPTRHATLVQVAWRAQCSTAAARAARVAGQHMLRLLEVGAPASMVSTHTCRFLLQLSSGCE